MKDVELADLMFGVEAVPIEAVVSGTGKEATRIALPGRKALLHAESRAVLGVVGQAYHIVTNARALTLAMQLCEKAFPTVKASEWAPARAFAPKTLTYGSIDLMHSSHVFNFSNIAGGRDDPYTPFVRVTNSFNGSRALRFDLGFMRSHCANGVIFEQDVATVKAAHGKAELSRLDDLASKLNLQGKWNAFSGFIDSIRSLPVSHQIALRLVQDIVRIPMARTDDPEWRRSELAILNEDLRTRVTKYRIELGENAYAVFNTITDFAARPPQCKVFNKDRTTLEERAGRWLRAVAVGSRVGAIDWEKHFGSLGTDVVRGTRAQRN